MRSSTGSEAENEHGDAKLDCHGLLLTMIPQIFIQTIAQVASKTKCKLFMQLYFKQKLIPTDCKKLSYRSWTARQAISVQILSTAAPLYEKSHLKRQ